MAPTGEAPQEGGSVFATVGTTLFDSLIATLLTPEVLDTLASLGYRRLVLQVGKGAEPPLPAASPLELEWWATRHIPLRRVCSRGARAHCEPTIALSCRYRFKPSLDDDMRAASLIISHAGAGSILEGMRLGALMVVVVNDALMHNHQEELAGELDARGHLLATVPSALAATLRELPQRRRGLRPMPAADPRAFGRYLGAKLGIYE